MHRSYYSVLLFFVCFIIVLDVARLATMCHLSFFTCRAAMHTYTSCFIIFFPFRGSTQRCVIYALRSHWHAFVLAAGNVAIGMELADYETCIGEVGHSVSL